MDEISDKMSKGRALSAKLFAGAKARGGGPMPAKLQAYTTEHLFGDVWQGDDLTLQQRSMITCTVLVALNRLAEQHIHFIGAKNLGIPRSEMEGMIVQVAHYAGWPCAASATHVLNEVWPAEA
jgi:4-carboxymuconolactone decarboxylase